MKGGQKEAAQASMVRGLTWMVYWPTIVEWQRSKPDSIPSEVLAVEQYPVSEVEKMGSLDR
jgi:hypothetical protein